MNRRPVVALLVSAATMAALAVPAGAASSGAASSNDWTRVVLPCRTGHKFAVLGYSPTHPWWLIGHDTGAGTLNPHRWKSWYSNPCKGQWLFFYTWLGDPSEDSYPAVSVAPGMSGKIPDIDPFQIATGTPPSLADAPACTNGGGDVVILQKPGAPNPCP